MNLPPIIPATGPGIFDLGEVTIFSLGNNTYIISAPLHQETWGTPMREAFHKLLPNAQIMVVYRPDGYKPTFTALEKSADLKALILKIIEEVQSS